MKTDITCLPLAVWLSVLFLSKQALSYGLDSGVTFRAKTSFIEYQFNDTSAFLGAYLRLEFSTTNCKGDLLLVTSRDTDDFYRVSLEKNKIAFYYKINDEEFDVQVSLPGNKTFCDGRKHTVELNRYSKTVTSKTDGGIERKQEETRMSAGRINFSKPDKIVLGGISSNKFEGCMYNAIILFYSSNVFSNISLNLIERYVKGDSSIHSANVFVGACPSTKVEECTRSSTNNSMTAGRGVIVSPRAIELSGISRCTWFITAPSKHRLKLTLLFYNVSGFVPCYKSQVTVYDGQSASDFLGQFCYTKSNTVIYTRDNHMMVDMLLPKSHYLDFIAVYEAVGLQEGPCPTNRRLTAMSGSLMSPNFPNNYEVEHECSWIITVPRDYHVLLLFNRNGFHIHSCNKTCDCDFLEVREGSSSKGKLLGVYCGSAVPSPILASDRHIWLRFVSDKVSNNKGFHATFQAIKNLADECSCNKTFTGHRRYISSPRFALDYPGNMDCTWRIHVSKKQRVALVFLGPINFDPNCTDTLEIRDGLDASSPLLKRYCATTATPPNIFSSGRAMYVRFKSDKYIRRDGSRSGFQATYFATPAKSGTVTVKSDIFAVMLSISLFIFNLLNHRS